MDEKEIKKLEQISESLDDEEIGRQFSESLEDEECARQLQVEEDQIAQMENEPDKSSHSSKESSVTKESSTNTREESERRVVRLGAY